MIKNFIRYFGGKKKLREEYLDMLPNTKNISLVISPFFGGGSFEYHLLNYLPKDTKVKGYDIDPLLVNYHRCFIESPEKLYETVKRYVQKPMTKSQYNKLGDRLLNDSKLNNFHKAAILLALSLNGYNGKIFSYAKKPSVSSLKTMKDAPRLKNKLFIDNKNGFKALENSRLTKRKDIFWFCDPPYWIKQNYYGFQEKQCSFNHERLARDLKKIKGKWLLCYNDCPEVMEAYKDYYIYEIPYNHTKMDTKKGKIVNNKYYELVITNYPAD